MSDLRAYRINGTTERDRHLVHLERDSKVTFGYRAPPRALSFRAISRLRYRVDFSKRPFSLRAFSSDSDSAFASPGPTV